MLSKRPSTINGRRFGNRANRPNPADGRVLCYKMTVINTTIGLAAFLRDDVTLSGAMDVLKEVLISVGSKPDLIESPRQTSRMSVYLPSSREGRKFKSRMQSLRLKGITVTLKVLKAADWQERWKRDIKPFALTKTFDVVPLWSSSGYQRKKRIPIYLDSILSFGTGLHETTRFMAGLIEACRGQFETCLDVGTGTGILSVIAYHCGAKTVDAVDIDPMSVQAAKNLRRMDFAAVKWPPLILQDGEPQHAMTLWPESGHS